MTHHNSCSMYVHTPVHSQWKVHSDGQDQSSIHLRGSNTTNFIRYALAYVLAMNKLFTCKEPMT